MIIRINLNVQLVWFYRRVMLVLQSFWLQCQSRTFLGINFYIFFLKISRKAKRFWIIIMRVGFYPFYVSMFWKQWPCHSNFVDDKIWKKPVWKKQIRNQLHGFVVVWKKLQWAWNQTEQELSVLKPSNFFF